MFVNELWNEVNPFLNKETFWSVLSRRKTNRDIHNSINDGYTFIRCPTRIYLFTQRQGW